jgi:tetratricopeptide (TPR) repeat protein
VGAAGLPATGGQGLPQAAQAQGFPERKPSGVMPAGIGLDMPSAGGEPAFGEFDPHAGGVNVGSVDLGQLGGSSSGSNVGGEMDLDAPAGGASGASGSLFRRERKADVGDDFVEAPRRSNLRFVAVGMAGFTLVGGLMTFNPAWGPFGSHLISDKVNASAYDEAVLALRTSTVASLDEDTLVAATTAADKARAELRERERHKDTAAYTAFVINMRSLRFGRDGGMETTAKALLEGLKEHDSVPLLLAMASSDALDGELARARQTISTIQSREPEDVDAAVLAGEIELKSKDAPAAVAAFSKATNLHKSARTLYGLARAQLAAGKRAEAEATARGALESSPSHVGARILIATIAATSPTREGEALKLLTEVTEDGPLKPLASPPELVEAFVQLGHVQSNASKISQAQEAFAGALRLDPQSVAALVGSGELYYRSARYSEAEARFESALKADADSLDAKIGTAKTWIALERTKEAKDHLTKLLTAYPKEPMVFYWAGRVNELLGQRKEAESDFRKAIDNAKTPEQGVPSYVALAALLASTNRAAEAATLLQDASKNYPGSPELAKARGEVALRSGKLEEALGQFEAALKKAPDDLSTRFFIGQTLMKMRKFDQAVAVLDAVQKIDPEYPGLSLERGLYYEETGQSEEALRMYESALKKAPNDVDLKLRIASTQVAAGAAKQAEPLLKEVIRERGNSAEANHFLGRAMLLSGSNLNEAMRHLRRAIELDANRAEYHLYVGWAANEAGQAELAEVSLEKALELDATLGDAYWQRGVLNQKLGRIDKALEDLEVALEKRPSRYEAHATMALCFEAQNNMSKAEASWRKAIAGNDKVAEFHYKLGELLERNGNKKDAMLELDKAVELGVLKEPRPAWLFRAYRLLGEGLEATNAEKALGHYQEYLRLAPKDDAYRSDVEASVEVLRKKLNR